MWKIIQQCIGIGKALQDTQSREALHVREVLQMLPGQIRSDCSQKKRTQGSSNPTK